MPGRRDDAAPSDAIGSGPRVLVQNGEYWLVNNGDLAMLRVTVDRLGARWPRSRIGVLTSSPLLLRARHPETEPITVPGRGGWPGRAAVSRAAARSGPAVCGPIATGALTLRELPQRGLARLRRVVPGRRARPRTAVGDLPPALRTTSLLITMGGGYITDVDPDQTRRTLALLEAAIDAGVPTAMVGQGLGPLDDPDLRDRARHVLPRVDLIAVRERLQGPALLDGLDVPADRVLVTGDDAIEMARGARSDELGTGLGVCLRIADYSPVATVARREVREAIRRSAEERGAPLVPLLVSEYRSEDRRSTLPLVKGFPDVVPPLGRYVTPESVAARVGRCRVLVTGAYHLAVFALSQGIPVVGLSVSRYYDDKLHGLADMFGGGLTVVRLDEPGLRQRIEHDVASAWSTASDVRADLRARADEQVAASRAAFARVFDLVDQRAQGTGTGRRGSSDPSGCSR